MNRAPVFFISHGAPTFAIEPGAAGARLRVLGASLSGVNAVLVVSPHWQTAGIKVMTNPAPETLHDFGGFAPALYELRYPAPGHPRFAAEAGRLLTEVGYAVGLDGQRGLDHGAWVPLMHLLPDARLPVFQVSMPQGLDTAGALRLGKALAPLREQGVMIVGSGSMTHNLYEIREPGADPAPYARDFAAWVRPAVLAGAADMLVAYRSAAPHAERAHPTEEHFLPLLVALGANAEGSVAQVIEGGISYGVLSMESYVWGLAEHRAADADSGPPPGR